MKQLHDDIENYQSDGHLQQPNIQQLKQRLQEKFHDYVRLLLKQYVSNRTVKNNNIATVQSGNTVRTSTKVSYAGTYNTDIRLNLFILTFAYAISSVLNKHH